MHRQCFLEMIVLVQWLKILVDFHYLVEHQAILHLSNAEGWSWQACVICKQCNRIEKKNSWYVLLFLQLEHWQRHSWHAPSKWRNLSIRKWCWRLTEIAWIRVLNWFWWSNKLNDSSVWRGGATKGSQDNPFKPHQTKWGCSRPEGRLGPRQRNLPSFVGEWLKWTTA